MPDQTSILTQRGVILHNPASVTIAPAVNPERIAPGVILHPGCRIRGAETAIGPGSEIGVEGPVTLDNCQLGTGVSLGGGYFSEATLLDGVSLGANAHVRPGTLLEEQVSCGHAAGLKQTILLPFAVTGSLINFCDCLLSGGTSRADHSEVGSAYVHFNYTPHQDKATPSLLGDVPRGVMLDQRPIFLGGQGGLVGPCRVTFGTIVAAGTLLRRDVLTAGRLVFGEPTRGHHEVPYDPQHYGNIHRTLENNFIYVGNLFALRAWHRHMRRLFVRGEPWAEACHAGAVARLDAAVAERLKRLAQLAGNLREGLADLPPGAVQSAPHDLHRAFINTWPSLQSSLSEAEFGEVAPAQRDAFLAAVEQRRKDDSYLETVRALPAEVKARGSAWLQAIVDATVTQCTV